MPTYYLGKFYRKLCENEEIWTGGRRPKLYYVDLPVHGIVSDFCYHILFVLLLVSIALCNADLGAILKYN